MARGFCFAAFGFGDFVLEADVLEADVLEADVLEAALLAFVPLTAGSLDRAEKRETPRWGIGASQPGKPIGGGPIGGYPSERKMGGLLASVCL